MLPWALSDHFPVYLVLSNAKLANKRDVKHIEISYRNTIIINEYFFSNDIAQTLLVDFSNQSSELENDVNGVVNLWIKSFNQINTNHCPGKKKRIKRQNNPIGLQMK